jgi:hypothetical protein
VVSYLSKGGFQRARFRLGQHGALARRIAGGWLRCRCRTWNNTSFPVWFGFIYFSVKPATTAHRNVRHIVLLGKYELTSSSENRTPPMGAPKATETPAAHDAERISRFFASFARYFGNHSHARLPQQLATWTNGPSLPKFSPAPTDKIRPSDLTNKVHPLRKCGMTNPPRIVLISGIPLPAAFLANFCTIHADSQTNDVADKTKAGKSSQTLREPVSAWLQLIHVSHSIVGLVSIQQIALLIKKCVWQYPNFRSKSHSWCCLCVNAVLRPSI